MFASICKIKDNFSPKKIFFPSTFAIFQNYYRQSSKNNYQKMLRKAKFSMPICPAGVLGLGPRKQVLETRSLPISLYPQKNYGVN